MAEVNIDIKRVRNANYNLPPIISSLSAQKRYVSMLRWRIQSEIQNKRNIRERIDSALRELERLEQQLNEIYKVTGIAVTQYMNVETNLTINAAKFQ